MRPAGTRTRFSAALITGALALGAAIAYAQAPAPSEPAGVPVQAQGPIAQGGHISMQTTVALPLRAPVYANAEWAPTSVQLHAGDTFHIESKGQPSWNIGSAPGSQRTVETQRLQIPMTDANGYSQTAHRPLNDHLATLPDANWGSLIGRIGENGTPFAVGSDYTGTASSDGQLYLEINDATGFFADNQGLLGADITVTPVATATTATATEATATATSTATTIGGGGQQPPEIDWRLPAALVGAAVLLLALIASMNSGRQGNRDRNDVPPRAAARLVSDGRAGQQISITARKRR